MKRCELKIMSCGSCKHPEFMTRKNASFCSTDYPSIVGVIEHPEEGVILFDTGYDAAFFEATKPFPERLYRWTTPVTINDRDSAVEQLKEIGYKAEDVQTIIISHFHGDHVAGLHNFPKARVVCSKVGLEAVNEGSRFQRVKKGFLSSLIPENTKSHTLFFEDCNRVTLPKDFLPFSDAVDIFNDGSILAVELPGHCPGHWGLVLHLESDQFVFLIADAAWSTQAVEKNIPPPKITANLLGFTKDYYKTLSSLRTLYQNNRNVMIVPSHCKIAAKKFNEGAE